MDANDILKSKTKDPDQLSDIDEVDETKSPGFDFDKTNAKLKGADHSNMSFAATPDQGAKPIFQGQPVDDSNDPSKMMKMWQAINPQATSGEENT
mmetsp:Transcript_5841/g.9369  ORF Transcript_5841/g.9369 Transcript_5841/m.9369 type:complete len:95 (+) Transcript_5841:1411-1695(+)